MKRKSLLLIAPLVISSAFLASCKGNNTRPEFSTLKAAVDVYDSIISEHRTKSTTISGTLNKFYLKGSAHIEGFKLPSSIPLHESIDITNSETTISNQKLMNTTVPISAVERVLNELGGKYDGGTPKKYNKAAGKKINVMGKVSYLFSYLLKLPINDFIVMVLDGFNVTGESEASLYKRMSSLRWSNLTPTYSFVGNGNNKKLSKIEIEIPSVVKFVDEVINRLSRTRSVAFTGDASVKGSLEVDTNTGYVKNINFAFNCDSFKAKSSGDRIIDVDVSKCNIDFSLTLAHTDADKVVINYQTVEYEPVFDKDSHTYVFNENTVKTTKYDSLEQLTKDTGLGFNWYFNSEKSYDDPVREKNYFYGDNKSVAYEGFDYDVGFYQTSDTPKYGLIVNSAIDADNTQSYSNIYKGDDTTPYEYKNKGKDGMIKSGSYVKYKTLIISSNSTEYDPEYSAYFSEATIEEKPNIVTHLFGSDLYNVNGAYTISIGIYKLNQ